MAFPQVTGSETSEETGNVTSHGALLPATIPANNWIVIVAGTDGAPTSTPPTGFTGLLTTAGQLHIFAKKAAGTEGGTTVNYTTSAAEQSATISLTGDDWSELIADIEASSGVTGANTDSPDPDNLAPSWGSDDNLFIAAFGGAVGTRTVTTYPTNYNDNQLEHNNGNGGPGATVGLASRELAAASDNPGIFLLNAALPWTAATIAIKPASGAATAGLTGTAVPTSTEADTVTGGKTIIITLTGDTFVTGTTSEDGIAAGSDSDIAASGTNWDSLIKTTLDNTDVVLSVGDTVATITLPAFGTYDIPGTETITWTIPAASLTTSASPIIATPTFTVTAVAAGLAIPIAMFNYRRRRA